jgi:hypothetical protein
MYTREDLHALLVLVTQLDNGEVARLIDIFDRLRSPAVTFSGAETLTDTVERINAAASEEMSRREATVSPTTATHPSDEWPPVGEFVTFDLANGETLSGRVEQVDSDSSDLLPVGVRVSNDKFTWIGPEVADPRWRYTSWRRATPPK